MIDFTDVPDHLIRSRRQEIVSTGDGFKKFHQRVLKASWSRRKPPAVSFSKFWGLSDTALQAHLHGTAAKASCATQPAMPTAAAATSAAAASTVATSAVATSMAATSTVAATPAAAAAAITAAQPGPAPPVAAAAPSAMDVVSDQTAGQRRKREASAGGLTPDRPVAPRLRGIPHETIGLSGLTVPPP